MNRGVKTEKQRISAVKNTDYESKVTNVRGLECVSEGTMSGWHTVYQPHINNTIIPNRDKVLNS